MMPRFLITILVILIFLLIVAVPFRRLILSDVETRNFRAATPGVFYRSGQMSPTGFERVLDEYGIRTVVSFRDSKTKGELAPDEFEADLCRDRTVAYHRFSPLSWSLPDGRIPATENVDRFAALINDPKTKWPILIHCFAGVHRTGVFTAIYRMEKEGWASADAIREMRTIGRDKSGFEADALSFLANYQPRTPRRTMPSVK